MSEAKNALFHGGMVVSLGNGLGQSLLRNGLSKVDVVGPRGGKQRPAGTCLELPASLPDPQPDLALFLLLLSNKYLNKQPGTSGGANSVFLPPLSLLSLGPENSKQSHEGAFFSSPCPSRRCFHPELAGL